MPYSFEQIAALDPDALIVDIAVGPRAGGLMNWNPSLEYGEEWEVREGTGPEASVERTQS